MAEVKDQVGKGETLKESFAVVHGAVYRVTERLAKIAEQLETEGNVKAGEAIRHELAMFQKPVEEWVID
jgi:hypothetical protein